VLVPVPVPVNIYCLEVVQSPRGEPGDSWSELWVYKGSSKVQPLEAVTENYGGFDKANL